MKGIVIDTLMGLPTKFHPDWTITHRGVAPQGVVQAPRASRERMMMKFHYLVYRDEMDDIIIINTFRSRSPMQIAQKEARIDDYYNLEQWYYDYPISTRRQR